MKKKKAVTEISFFKFSLPQKVDLNIFNKLINLSSEEGFIVTGQNIEKWKFLGLKQEEGKYCIYGPNFKGQPLIEILKSDKKKALESLLKLAKAFQTLGQNKIKQFEIYPASIFFLETGGILFLPPSILKKLREIFPEETWLEYLQYNNPYATNLSEAFSYSLAVFCYLVFSGKLPFTAKKTDELRALIRHGRPVPINLLNPVIRDEISEEISNYFKNRKQIPFSLAKWEKMLTAWLDEGFSQKLNLKVKSVLKHKREQFLKQEKRRLVLKLFWEKNGKTILIAGGISLVGIAFLALLLSSIFRPRQTKGFTPQQVVESYYNAINSLEVDLMRDCLTEGAGAEEISRAEWLFVINRQALAYQQQDYRIPADVWDKKGRPKVTEPYYIDGIIDLQIKQLKSEPEPIFEASYKRWIFLPAAEGISGQQVFAVKEKLALKQKNGDWVIYQIIKLAEERLAE